ncbi:MAG: DUF2141 domain-containing protein [Sphingomicrobium sp.]
MSKSRLLVPAVAIGALLLLALSAPAASATSACAPGKPAVMVHVAGLKQVSGQIKVSLYGSDTRRWLAKKGRISKVKVPVTGRAMNICMAVPAPGRYAVAVHHDLNANGDRDSQDGGGYSRNPKVGLLNPKPAFDKAAFTVGSGPARVGVTLLYIRGLSVGPAQI